MRDLLSDGILVLYTDYRIDRLCTLRRFGWNYVARNY